MQTKPIIATADRPLPGEVAQFCSRHAAIQYLNEAVSLAEATFEPVHPIELELATDHETGEQRVVVQTTVHMAIDDVLARYDQLVRQWVSITPPDMRYLFSFSYDIRDPK